MRHTRDPEHDELPTRSTRRFRPTHAFIAGFAILLAAAGGSVWLAADWSRKRALEDLAHSSRHVLNLVSESLRGELAKHQSTPFLIARNPVMARVVTRAASEAELGSVNHELARLASVTDASDIYLMDTAGNTVAASNYAQPRSFIGNNFSYRPYFIEAMKGQLGRYFALGTTSGERGYFFAHPIFEGRYVVGVAVVKVRLDELEASWRAKDHEIMVVDDDGVVFLASEPSRVLRSIAQLSAEAAQRIEAQRRYDGRQLTGLGVEVVAQTVHGDLVEIPVPQGPADTGFAPTEIGNAAVRRAEYLLLESPMPSAGWSVRMLASTRGIARQVSEAVALVLVTIAAALLAGLALYQRRRRVAERLQMQATINAELERRVAERTDELTRANAQLEAEVAERTRAERDLRQTQNDLVQASKLAALGQMSAGLSHELNQPLAAIRSFADNAVKFLERDRPDTAARNLTSIVDLTERMARIIRHLRTYARKEPTTTRPTPVDRCIEDALALLARRIEDERVTVNVDVAEPVPVAAAGEVRLQQVLVNLVSNGLDAMRGSDRRVLAIRADEADGAVRILISDTGPGIAAADLASVFDPFFTTKDVGEGLGLGLSITYGIVQQFGGTISVRNNEAGGAVFEVRLKPASTAIEHAA